MTETLESLNPKNKSHFCPIRKTAVSELPEEKVRVQLLFDMIERLGYPASMIAVEKELATIPSLKGSRGLPQRRADIICFAKRTDESLSPLLLIECKAVNITNRMINQAVGYNHYLKAPFIALVNQHEIRTGWLQQGIYEFIPFLPTYSQLLSF